MYFSAKSRPTNAETSSECKKLCSAKCMSQTLYSLLDDEYTRYLKFTNGWMAIGRTSGFNVRRNNSLRLE
uniref:Uncharacterized protein n=1 Tax=Romanomermis culicivorax TaxID=13658 RepID=A0A915J6M5_ROMCU